MRELHPGSRKSSEPDEDTRCAAPCFSTVLEFPSTVTEDGKHEMLESLEPRQMTTGNSGVPEHGEEEERVGFPAHALDPTIPKQASAMRDVVCHI